MALRAQRPSTIQTAPEVQAQAQAPVNQAPTVAPQPQAQALSVVGQNNSAVANVKPGSMQDLNAGILDNIDGMGNAGNYITMDGTNFLNKSTEETFVAIDLVVSSGKRYYQWVEESVGEGGAILKTFHDSDVKLDDRYKLKFELKWAEDGDEEGDEPKEVTINLPTASAMRFIDYVKALAKAGFGVGQVVTNMTISRQTRQGSTDRYSRTEFTMIGTLDADGNMIEIPVASRITTVGKTK